MRRIVTGNAAENAPMIAVNDMMGFEIAGAGWFWQKDGAGRLTAPGRRPACHRAAAQDRMIMQNICILMR